MAGDESDFVIPITADVSGAVEGFKQVEESAHEMGEAVKEGGEEGESGLSKLGEAAQESGEQMGEHAENVGKAISGWQGLLGVIGAGAVAEVMNKIAETTMEVGDQMRTLSAVLGTNINDARGFSEAMSSLGVDSNAAMMAIRRLEMDAETGGKKLAGLGISAKDASGELKTGGEIFEQVVDKLNNLSSAADKTNAATALLGRTGYQLLGVLPELSEAIDRNREEQEKNAATNEMAAQNSLKLHEVLTQLNSLWEDISIKMSGAVVDAFQELLGDAKELATEITSLTTILRQLSSGAEEMGAQIRAGIGGAFKWVADQVQNATTALQNYMRELHNAVAERLGRDTGLHSGADPGDTNISDDLSGRSSYFPYGGEGGSGVADFGGGGTGKWTPPSGKGKKGKKGDDFTGLDQSLEQASDKMDDLNKKFQQLGSEASMAAKEGGKSFDQLRSQAVADYQDMQTKYQQFQDAVENGSKKSAMAAEKAWHEAATKFEQDWKLASEKAKQDMQAITKTADQISSEISGVLNSAISGKLNWAQEFQKILSKMADALVKHLTQQIAMWIAHEAQVNAVKTAGGAQGLAIQKTQNAVAGTSDAVTAAKGAYASAAQVPYIGWIIAPAAAAAAFVGVEAFGSAAQGFDVPTGVNPITQLHAKEMVLPANLAQGVRNMTGQGGGGQRNTNNHTWNVNAFDGKSVVDMLRSNSTVLAAIGAAHERSGGRHYTG